MGYVPRPGGGGGGSSYSAPAWEWWHDDCIDISSLTDVGDADAGGAAFTSTSYDAGSGRLTGAIDNGADSCWELAQIADGEDFVYAAWVAVGGGTALSVAANVFYGLAFAKRDGASFALADDDYYSATARDSSSSSSSIGRASSNSGWTASPGSALATSAAVDISKRFVMQRVGAQLTGFIWLPGGALKQAFTVAGYGGVGRLLIGAQNQGTATTNTVHLIRARTTGLSISDSCLVVA